MDVNKRLEQLGILLPEAPNRAGLYVQTKEFGERMVYVSGCGPDLNGKEELKGKLGEEISIEQGQQYNLNRNLSRKHVHTNSRTGGAARLLSKDFGKKLRRSVGNQGLRVEFIRTGAPMSKRRRTSSSPALTTKSNPARSIP